MQSLRTSGSGQGPRAGPGRLTLPMKSAIPWILLFLFAAAPLLSQSSADDFFVKQKGFIRELHGGGDYFSCIGETRRYLFHAGEIKNRGAYEFFIYGNYFMGRQYRTVVHHFTREAKPAESKEWILLSQAYLKLGYHDLGYRSVKDLRYGAPGTGDAWELLIRKMEPLLLDHAYEEALAEAAGAKNHVIEEKYTRLYDSLVKSREIRYRSGPLAAAMSLVLPGAGQVYTGNLMNGLATLLGVAATAGGGWYLLKRGERGAGFSLFFFSGLFYAGGIYGAWNSSDKYNSEADRNYVRDMQRRYIPSYAPVTDRDLKELFN